MSYHHHHHHHQQQHYNQCHYLFLLFLLCHIIDSANSALTVTYDLYPKTITWNSNNYYAAQSVSSSDPTHFLPLLPCCSELPQSIYTQTVFQEMTPNSTAISYAAYPLPAADFTSATLQLSVNKANAMDVLNIRVIDNDAGFSWNANPSFPGFNYNTRPVDSAAYVFFSLPSVTVPVALNDASSFAQKYNPVNSSLLSLVQMMHGSQLSSVMFEFTSASNSLAMLHPANNGSSSLAGTAQFNIAQNQYRTHLLLTGTIQQFSVHDVVFPSIAESTSVQYSIVVYHSSTDFSTDSTNAAFLDLNHVGSQYQITLVTTAGVNTNSITYPGIGTAQVVNGASPYIMFTAQDEGVGTAPVLFRVLGVDENDGISDPGTVASIIAARTSGIAEYNFSVTLVNEKPIVPSKTINATEDTLYSGNIMVSNSDNDGISQVLVASLPVFGVLTLDSTTGAFTYMPNLNVNSIDVGLDSFSVIAVDNSTSYLASDPGIYYINIISVPDRPVTLPFNISMLEDASGVSGSFQDYSSDGDVGQGATLVYKILTRPTIGTVTLSGSRSQSFLYTPLPNANGYDFFVYNATDVTGLTSVASTVWVYVTPVNDRPVVNASSTYSVLENSLLVGQLPGYDIDNPVSDLTFIGKLISSQITFGSLTVFTNGTFRFMPTTYYHGHYLFTYSIADLLSVSTDGNVDITVTAVQNQPTAVNFNVNTDEDVTSQPVSLLSYLSNPDGGPTTFVFTIITPPTKGSVNLQPGPSGIFTYTPNTYVFGLDTFTYRATNATLGYTSNTATVTVDIAHINQPAVPACNATVTLVTFDNLMEDTTFKGQLFGYDVDSPRSDMVFTQTQPLIPSGALEDPVNGAGSIVIYPNGNFTVFPPKDYSGTMTFAYDVRDCPAATAPACLVSSSCPVQLTIANVPDAPVGYDQAVTVLENSAVNPIDLINDHVFDADGTVGVPNSGGPFTAQIVTPPQNGTLTGPNGAGIVNYAASVSNYWGIDSFTYTIKDPTNLVSNPVTVSITIQHVHYPPTVPATLLFPGTEDTLLNGALQATGDSALTFSLKNSPPQALGTLTLDVHTGQFTFMPALNYFGDVTFKYRVSDQVSLSTVCTVTLRIANVPNAPTLADLSIVINEDQSIPIVLSAQVSSLDHITLFYYNLVTSPVFDSNFALGNTLGTYIYTPNHYMNGQDMFTYTVFDGTLNSTVATVNITIVPVNDPPITNATARYSGVQGIPMVGQLPGFDYDNPTTDLTFSVLSLPDASEGDLVYYPNGSFTFYPSATYSGLVSFDYVVRDLSSQSTPSSAQINLADVNDAPRASDSTFQVIEGSKDNHRKVTASDLEDQMDQLKFQILDGPYAEGANLTMAPFGSGEFIYEATYKYPKGPIKLVRNDNFTFKVTDTGGLSATGTVYITVAAASEAYSCNNGTQVNIYCVTNAADQQDQCPPGVIEGAQVCDGFPDCANFSDERHGCTSQFMKSRKFVFVLVAITILVAVIFMILTIVYRKKAVIKFSSPIFLLGICCGVILGALSVLWYWEVPSKSICLLEMWTPNMAFMLIFGNLVMKTYRIYVLFHSAEIGKFVAIRNREVFAMVFGLLAIDAIILIIWQYTSPLKPELRVHPAYDPALENHTVYQKRCHSSEFKPFVAVLLAEKFVMLLAGCFYATHTRHVDKRFRETKYILIIVYTWLFAALVFLPVLMTNSLAAAGASKSVFHSLAVLIVINLTQIILFLPKFLNIWGHWGFGHEEEDIDDFTVGKPQTEEFPSVKLQYTGQ